MPLAAVAPLVCTAHCLSTPFLLALLPSIAVNRLVEAVLVLIAIMVGMATLAVGIRIHGLWRGILTFGAAVVVWSVALLYPAAPASEAVMMVIAGILAAGAILWDAHLRGAVSRSASTVP